MIRYKYNRQTVPPAPMIYVRVAAWGNDEFVELPAQIDSGADLTVIPSRLDAELGLTLNRWMKVVGLGGVEMERHTALIHLMIGDRPAVTADAMLDPDEPHVLLGRDVLNQFRIVLDGPKLMLEIE